jgi:plastocyanin
MRKVFGIGIALALVAAFGLLGGLPPRATAQGGGTIEAAVKYSGAPQIETVKVNKDVEQCGQEKKIEKVAVGSNKGLANAVVSVADAKGPTTAKPVSLDQKGCEFHPHVVGMTPGEIDILNSDGILHNIHTFSTANPTLNKAQPKFKKVMKEKFAKPEIIRVQCDVHSWMHGWIAVMPNPYFGVTDDKGATKIENVPAGKHKIEVWHPVLGKQSKEVDVKAGQVTKVAFELKK